MHSGAQEYGSESESVLGGNVDARIDHLVRHRCTMPDDGGAGAVAARCSLSPLLVRGAWRDP